MSHKERLDTNLVKYTVQLYSDKTAFKDVAGQEDLYRQVKEYINSLYGMCVTNTIRDEVEFAAGHWGVLPLTISDAEKKLDDLTKRHRTFLNYSWGVWITAYARFNLWDVILPMADDVVYSDTDSIKYIDNDNEKYFTRYNEKITQKLVKAVEYHGLDLALINPIDKKGICRPLGVYDDEGVYDKFITLGAKKYCAEKNGKLDITISGVAKTGVKALTGISDFKEGLTFDYNTSGRLIMSYNDDQPEMTLTDYLGNTQTIYQQYGINAMPTTYTLGMSDSFNDYLTRMTGQTSTHMTLLIGKEDLPL